MNLSTSLRLGIAAAIKPDGLTGAFPGAPPALTSWAFGVRDRTLIQPGNSFHAFTVEVPDPGSALNVTLNHFPFIQIGGAFLRNDNGLYVSFESLSGLLILIEPLNPSAPIGTVTVARTVLYGSESIAYTAPGVFLQSRAFATGGTSSLSISLTANCNARVTVVLWGTESTGSAYT